MRATIMIEDVEERMLAVAVGAIESVAIVMSAWPYVPPLSSLKDDLSEHSHTQTNS